MIGKLGVFGFRRRWWVVTLWLVVMIAGSTALGSLFDNLGDTTSLPGTETGQAQKAIDDGIDRGEQFFAVVDRIDANAAQTQSVLSAAVSDVSAIDGVKEASGPTPSTDGRAAVIEVTLKKADSQFQPFTDAKTRLDKLSTELPGSTVEIGGGDLISDQANDAVQSDLSNAELYSLPLTIVVLVFVFGGIIAAGLPALAAIGTMLGASAILLGFQQVITLDANVITVVTLLGLGLSIDYGLLLVARYREELARTGGRVEAVRRAWGTAGRTIFFSALTVSASLTGLMAFDIGRLRALAAAGIATSLVAMLAGLTFTAALIGLLGRWIKPSKKERARAEAAAQGGAGQERAQLERGFFARLARVTQRAPLIAVLVTAAALVVVATPLLHVVIKVPQLEGLPRSIEAVRVADVLDNRFGMASQPGVRIVARTDAATLDTYAARWATDPEVLHVEKADALNPSLSIVDIAVKGDGQGKAAQDLVGRLRADRPVGYESWVTGDAAVLIDLDDRLISGLPLAIAITILAMIILLYLMSGSVVIPLKAVVLNVLSLAATFGVLVAVFQDGWLSGPLDTLTVGGLSPFMIVIVFAFAFGLSMDYEVFILSRIKEYVDAGEDSNASVRLGLQRSGRIITSAALLMLIVFACFAAAKVGQLEQIGLGLFVAVLIDATLVRCLLVPAVMSLLGRAAWWAPGPLRRLHGQVGLDEHELPAPPVAAPVPERTEAV
jgi:putative drug exporter of the RND superfamily